MKLRLNVITSLVVFGSIFLHNQSVSSSQTSRCIQQGQGFKLINAKESCNNEYEQLVELRSHILGLVSTDDSIIPVNNVESLFKRSERPSNGRTFKSEESLRFTLADSVKVISVVRLVKYTSINGQNVTVRIFLDINSEMIEASIYNNRNKLMLSASVNKTSPVNEFQTANKDKSEDTSESYNRDVVYMTGNNITLTNVEIQQALNFIRNEF
ncbi:MAG: hypothetical protein AAGF07_03750 [Patescibacteria group bacterium]